MGGGGGGGGVGGVRGEEEEKLKRYIPVIPLFCYSILPTPQLKELESYSWLTQQAFGLLKENTEMLCKPGSSFKTLHLNL